MRRRGGGGRGKGGARAAAGMHRCCAVLSPQPRPPHLGTYYLELGPDNLPCYSHNPLPPSVDQKQLPWNIQYSHVLCSPSFAGRFGG
eukprot:357565-Chlamydomonas_euryale.AAC.2